MESDENIFHAAPQVRGRIAHEAVDNKKYSTRSDSISSISVCSEELGISGKIDLYLRDKKLLVERIYSFKQIYRGQLYQLWAEYFCMLEMGYEIERLSFYETSTNKMIPVHIPGTKEKSELVSFIKHFRNFSPDYSFPLNHNKCTHCVYCNLCDKTDTDNVYT